MSNVNFKILFKCFEACIEDDCKTCPARTNARIRERLSECSCKTMKPIFLPRKLAEQVRDLLKVYVFRTDDPKEQNTGHWIFDSEFCEAWSHTCSECGKMMTTAVGHYANWCWNCGAKMEKGGSSDGAKSSDS